MQITAAHKGLVSRILGKAVITSDLGESITISALWDTGATHCMITDRVAQKLNLVGVGSIEYYHAGGVGSAATYEVALEIQGDLKQECLKMDRIKIPAMADAHDFDMIIGMDIIKHGDFHIKNDNGNTLFTFAC